MLTRLKVSGFKNLVDVDLSFGPFTCVAGPNGVGKSNIFDAIQFLRRLADEPLMTAASAVRDEGGRSGDISGIFHRFGDSHSDTMRFEVEMLVPEDAIDDLGQIAPATSTFLRYTLVLRRRLNSSRTVPTQLEVLQEDLAPIGKRESGLHLPFRPKKAWRDSVVRVRTRSGRAKPFISTVDGNVQVHQDGGSRGRPLKRSASQLARTVLSISNAAESPTATVARAEMRSWALLQLEPSALRKPDEFSAPSRLDTDGSHLPATLHRLWREDENDEVYARISNRLAELIDDVYEVSVDEDPKRELLTLMVRSSGRTVFPARDLSDGTLRFLALAIIRNDPRSTGMVCMEEPENGIHPDRIPAILRLLRDIATDTTAPVSEDNPLRQVIINTHSPLLVREIADDDLVMAESRVSVVEGVKSRQVALTSLDGTWRTRLAGGEVTSKGRLMSYLGTGLRSRTSEVRGQRRVVDRPDIQELLSFMVDS